MHFLETKILFFTGISKSGPELGMRSRASKNFQLDKVPIKRQGFLENEIFHRTLELHLSELKAQNFLLTSQTLTPV